MHSEGNLIDRDDDRAITKPEFATTRHKPCFRTLGCICSYIHVSGGGIAEQLELTVIDTLACLLGYPKKDARYALRVSASFASSLRVHPRLLYLFTTRNTSRPL